MADIVVVGSCMTDLVSFVPELPKPGETLFGNKFLTGFGGKGANQAVVAARLGANVAMVAKVGDDSFGHNYIQNFKENKINVDYVSTTREAPTGVAPISVTPDGQNAIVIISGANLYLSENDLQKAEPVIKTAKVVLCQLEISTETALATLKMAKKHGVKTILNPAPGQQNLDPEIYANTDIMCPNESEAAKITGINVDTMEDAHKAIKWLLDQGCGMVILTLGKKGSVFATKENPTPIHIPAKQVKTVDSTGAGDAFVGALAFYLAHYSSIDLQEAIRRSGEIATISVQKTGTQTSYPWRKDIPRDLFSNH
ncbi:ribokinase [Lingula anatina]|uniref:Ribokinase n=1 Tax=Lingula anatina TaxID=7574 RepID=A0A1S3J2I3_LINAN|nr:ribokinase [Lingula anatina]XP_013404622.1 ribokinase [Lingula anatina]|eukprot:XP_013404621.1 ribokinase [Lingula anatina]